MTLLAPPVIASTIALVCTVMALIQPSAIYALLYLLAGLISLAAAFFALGADFAGALQIVVYVGAILVIFVFVVMTVDVSQPALTRERLRLKRAWAVPALLVLIAIVPFLTGLPVDLPPGDAVTARDVGLLLFSDWIVIVELVSLLLLAGLIAARHLGRSDQTGTRL